jgi:hypothetical protein
MTGMPSAVVIRYSRNPQKNREWLAQYPYPACPARSERFTGSLLAAHGSGVESTSRSTSCQEPVSRASSVIAAAEQPGLAAQPLAVPGLPRQVREQPGQVLAGVADPPPLAGDAQQVLGGGQA